MGVGVVVEVEVEVEVEGAEDRVGVAVEAVDLGLEGLGVLRLVVGPAEADDHVARVARPTVPRRPAAEPGVVVPGRALDRHLRGRADATIGGTRKEYLADLAAVPLLILDDLGMRKLPHTAAEDLLELVMRRYERSSTILTSNRPVDDWGKLLGDTAAVTALLDRLLHHAHFLKCGPRSWRAKVHADLRPEEPAK